MVPFLRTMGKVGQVTLKYFGRGNQIPKLLLIVYIPGAAITFCDGVMYPLLSSHQFGGVRSRCV